MTKERELLEETLLFLDEFEYPTIVEEIRAFLAAEPEADEPVAWIQPNHLDKAQFMPFLCRVEPKQRDDFIPIYTRPEPEAEPVAWMWLALEDGEVITQYGPYLPNLFRNTGTPLYLHPPKPAEPAIRKPMTEEEIDEEIATNEHYCERSFAEGVRWAEKHHGVGGR